GDEAQPWRRDRRPRAQLHPGRDRADHALGSGSRAQRRGDRTGGDAMKPAGESTFEVPRILMRRWWSILLCAAIGAGIAALYALAAPNWYSTKISVVPLQATQSAGVQGSALPSGLDALSVAAQ